MKVKHLVLAVIGAAALTGCQNNVMESRGYVPAPAADDPAPMAPRETPAAPAHDLPPQTPAAHAEPAPARVSAAPRFEPMTGVVSSGGVDSARAAVKPAAKGSAVQGGVYVVQPGDYPEKIARKLHVKLGDLMKANDLTPAKAKRLRVGQKLTIPAGNGKAAEPRKKGSKSGAKAKATGEKTPAAEVKDGIYVVQPGDFPEKIARKLHVKLGDLMKANDLTPAKASRLQVGQKLVVPGKSAVAAASAPKQAAAPAPAADSSDDLNQVLRQAEGTAVKNGSGNAAAGIDADKDVVVSDGGQVETIETEISIDEFARLHNTTAEALRKVNPGLMPDTLVLKKGETLFVPGK